MIMVRGRDVARGRRACGGWRPREPVAMIVTEPA
jgi:hypothetical protein